MRQSTTLLQLQTLQTVRGRCITPLQFGHKTMACLSGKGHGKKEEQSLRSTGLFGNIRFIEELKVSLDLYSLVMVREFPSRDFAAAAALFGKF